MTKYEDYEAYLEENKRRDENGERRTTWPKFKKTLVDPNETFHKRLLRIAGEVELADNFFIIIDQDKEVENGRFYYQIQCWRKDVITGEMGYGYGGKAYLSPHQTNNELVQTIFGLYKGYWEHEARESFKYRGRRVFGPHIDVEALWEAAPHVDIRSAKHVDDKGDSKE